LAATVLVLCPRWKWRTTNFRRTVHELTQRGQSVLCGLRAQ
jgi:hypothetical protein